jgi:hypothetical protein
MTFLPYFASGFLLLWNKVAQISRPYSNSKLFVIGILGTKNGA